MNNFLLIGIIIFVHLDDYIPKRDKQIILGCITLAIILNFQQFFIIYHKLPQYRHLVFLRLLESWIGYSTRPFLLWGLWELLKGTKRKLSHRLFMILSFGNILVFTSGFFSPLPYYIDPVTLDWNRGPLGYTAHIVMLLMMFLFIPVLYDLYSHNQKLDFLVGVSLPLAVLISTIYDTFFNHATLNTIITYEIVLYFLFLHIGPEKEYTKALIKAQKAEMMLMQIKPHFINNTLGTIQALCEVDPKLAAHTTGSFAKYLRTNLTAMDKPLPIPIEEEIEHTKTYLEIEMLRFPWIHVEYDICDTSFCVPLLSVQPLAENAVQHGLRKNKNGKLIIRTYAEEKGHIIQIIDNGTGFSENSLETEEGHGVGIRNVKYRIEKISHGTLTVESIMDEGTTITVFIP